MASKQSSEGNSTLKNIFGKVNETASGIVKKANELGNSIKGKIKSEDKFGETEEDRDISGREKPVNREASVPVVSAETKSNSEGKFPAEMASVNSLSDKVKTTFRGEPGKTGKNKDSANPQREPAKGGRHTEPRAKVQDEPLKRSDNPRPSGGNT